MEVLGVIIKEAASLIAAVAALIAAWKASKASRDSDKTKEMVSAMLQQKQSQAVNQTVYVMQPPGNVESLPVQFSHGGSGPPQEPAPAGQEQNTETE